MLHSSTGQTAIVCAYLINQYPKVSHSFVRREILALERRGISVHRFAIRGWDESPVDPQDTDEQARTRYVLQGGVVPVLLAAAWMLLMQPVAFCAALRMAVVLSRGSERSLPYHLFYLAEAARLARWLRQARVTHLHAHFGTNSADVAVLAARMANCECSFTVHGPEEFDKPAAIHLKEKAKASKFVVAVSSFGRSQLYRWLDWADWGKVKVAHCGLDQHFLSEEPDPVPEVPHLVCVGRLCEQKGQYLLVQAARLLAREGLSFRLTLAGDGELRASIERYVAQESLEGHVQITGWLSGEQVKGLLRQSRAMILPSFAEGLPVVIMEAMAMGRPVLSTYVAGIPELVRHGVTGWLFPAGDVEQMAHAMRECLNTPAPTLQAMGDEGRQRVLARHDVDRSAELLARWIASGVASVSR